MDFHQRRRELEPAAWPHGIRGWNPAGTYTGDPRPAIGLDRFDSRRSENPYPLAMPSLHAQQSQGRPAMDVHADAMQREQRVAHEATILFHGGDTERRKDAAVAILRKKALMEEMGTGVVLLDEAEEAVLRDPGDEAGAL